MAFKRPKRGVSVSTIIMLSLTTLTLLIGAFFFVRISGDVGDISLGNTVLTEPINVLVRAVTETGESPVIPENAPETPQAAPLASAEPTASPEPTLPPSRTLVISAVGQITMGAELRASGDGSPPTYDAILAPMAGALRGSDLSIATLRSGLTTDSSRYDTFTAPSALAASLRASGLNMLNFATDRVMDHGMRGITDTLGVLGSQGIGYTGIYADANARQSVQILDINGIQVGIVPFTASISNSGKSAASDSEIATATRFSTAQSAAADVAAARSGGADLVIVLANWGGRADTKATADMRTAADALLAAGADIILGTGPTSVLEMERRSVTDSNGTTRETFVAYSLGNFLTDESRDTLDITGVALRLTVQWDAQTQRATFTDNWYMPTWIMRYRDDAGANRYRIVPADSAQVPEGMTDSIYVNMKKAYQSMVTKVGTEAATPKSEP